MAYEWCSLICEKHQGLRDRESFLLLSLEIGFRHLDPQDWWTDSFGLTHTEHHRGLVSAVFESGNNEAIADLLHAWTVESLYHEPAHSSLGICTEHLVGLHHLVPFSLRLRRLTIRSVRLIGYNGFKGVGMERFFRLLNHLCVTVKDTDVEDVDIKDMDAEDVGNLLKWKNILLDILQSPGGIQHLSHWYWELLVEFAIRSWWGDDLVYNPQIVISLTEAEEWDKLECWIGTIWIIWPPGAGEITEEDLGRLMLFLSRQRPGAVQKLTQRMEEWSQKSGKGVPECFERICKQAREAAQQDLL